MSSDENGNFTFLKCLLYFLTILSLRHYHPITLSHTHPVVLWYHFLFWPTEFNSWAYMVVGWVLLEHKNLSGCYTTKENDFPPVPNSCRDCQWAVRTHDPLLTGWCHILHSYSYFCTLEDSLKHKSWVDIYLRRS